MREFEIPLLLPPVDSAKQTVSESENYPTSCVINGLKVGPVDPSTTAKDWKENLKKGPKPWAG